jgi:hypothetical protein
MSKSENDLEDCNLFPKDYDEYNAQKYWLKRWNALKNGSLQWNEKKLWQL